MIVKKKILSNEISNKKNKNLIHPKDKHLFINDFKVKIEKSFFYHLRDATILNDGKIFTLNYDIIYDYLGLKTLSKFILIKKLILITNYIFSILYKKKIIKNINITKDCILIHNRNSHGYFHWVTDTLPKIIYIKTIYKKPYVVLPEKLKIKFIISSLKKFKIKFFFLSKNNNYTFKKLTYIGELYPSGNPRKKIIEKLKNLVKFKDNKSARIYISRNKSNRRKIINEKSLIKVLKKYNFKTIYSEKLTFQKQISIFSSAKYILGLHGAGLSNILWMNKKTFLLELRPEKDLFLNCYFNLANLLDINYYYLICKRNNFFTSSKSSNYKVDIKLFEKKLKEMLRK